MTTEIGIGVSSLVDAREAALAAAKEAHRTCSAPALVIVFVTHGHSPSALSAVCDAVAGRFPAGTRLAGGTVNGVVHDGVRHDALYAGRAVAVLALRTDEHAIGVALLAFPDDPAAGGREVARAARTPLDRAPRTGLLFTPGLSAEPSIDPLLLEGIGAELPGVRLSGAGLCGGLDIAGVPLPGFAFLDGRIEHRGTLLILFESEATGCSGANGLHSSGASAEITAATGPLVHELDGRPAREVVLELLGGNDPDLCTHIERAPVVACVENGIGLAATHDDFYWIHMPSGFATSGAMIDPFHPKEGMRLSVVRMERDSCMNAVREAAELLVEDAGTSTFDLVLSFSCALRGFTLGGEAANEDALLARALGAKRQLGIIANGEIACHGAQGPFATGWLYALFGLGMVAR